MVWFILFLSFEFLISYEFHFAPETLLVEFRIRSLWILIGLGLTWFTCYWFSEELIYLLAKPVFTLPIESYFVCTKLVEAFSTYIAMASIACAYFVFPLINHQLWCFLVPSSYGDQKTKYIRLFYLSGFCFCLFLFLTFFRAIPYIWDFLYGMGTPATPSLTIRLQLKIYDYIIFTLRISFISSICSQVPVIVIRLVALKGLYVDTVTNNRRFLVTFSLIAAALSTPPDIWCQSVALFIIHSMVELSIFVSLVIHLREEGWTSGWNEGTEGA